ncbi:MAG: ferredoxin family protein [Candidatus Thorarchaeota archaeon]
MPIDRTFKTSYAVKEIHHGHTVWSCPEARFGIHGTRVAVDFDECTGCLKCITVCPENVFLELEVQSGQVKADPIREGICLECLACELVCPVEAIFITREPSEADTLRALLD